MLSQLSLAFNSFLYAWPGFCEGLSLLYHSLSYFRANLSESLLDQIAKSDQEDTPPFDDNGTEVQVSFHLNSISSLRAANMDYWVSAGCDPNTDSYISMDPKQYMYP